MIPLSSQTLMMNVHHGQTQEYVLKPKYYPAKKMISEEQSTESSLPLRVSHDQLASSYQCEYDWNILDSDGGLETKCSGESLGRGVLILGDLNYPCINLCSNYDKETCLCMVNDYVLKWLGSQVCKMGKSKANEKNLRGLPHLD